MGEIDLVSIFRKIYWRAICPLLARLWNATLTISDVLCRWHAITRVIFQHAQTTSDPVTYTQNHPLAFATRTVNYSYFFFTRAKFGTWLGLQCGCYGRTGVNAATPAINNAVSLWTTRQWKTWRYFHLKKQHSPTSPHSSNNMHHNYITPLHKQPTVHK